MTPFAAAALGLVLLALVHSALGEARLLASMLNNWTDASLPAKTASVVLRSAWHAASLAWLGIALLLVGVSPALAVVVAAGIPGVVILIVAPTHPAWGLMLFISAAVAYGEGLLPPALLTGGALGAAIALLVVAGWHFYWAFGGRIGMAAALPDLPGDSEPRFQPSSGLTALVALAIACYATALVLLVIYPACSLLNWGVGLGVLVFVGRAIGDRRYVGLSKTVRGTRFSRLDDRYFTPLVVLFAFGSWAALLL